MAGPAGPAILVAVDAQGLATFRTPEAASTEPATGELRALPLSELVRWGSPAELQPQTAVILADGGRLVTAAAWAGGAAVRLQGESVIVLSDVFGEVPLPRERVRGIVFAQRSHSRERERLEEALREPQVALATAEADAVLRLTNGDRVGGRVTALSGGSLTFATDLGEVKLPLSRVETVLFSQPGRQAAGSLLDASAKTGSAAMIVGLRDGSLLPVEKLQTQGNELSLTIARGADLVGGSANDLALVQSLGGKFVYLSDLEPVEYRHVPYLSMKWPYQRDRNALGEPLSAGGRRYLKGVGMHSASRLTYRLDGQYQRFDAAVALDDSAGNKGSVTFGLYVLRDGTWKQAYASEIVRGGEGPLRISVDLTGAEGLTLTVDFADRGDELDRANWLDARLIKNG